jgi:hypothetical protein
MDQVDQACVDASFTQHEVRAGEALVDPLRLEERGGGKPKASGTG